jgi:hypothetical protein
MLALISHKGLADEEARLVAEVFVGEPLVHNDGELEVRLQLPLAQLGSAIRRMFRGSPGVTLHWLVRWSRHIRALDMSQQGKSLIEIAVELSVDERSIQREANALRGRPFRECVSVGPDRAVEALLDRLRVM